MNWKIGLALAGLAGLAWFLFLRKPGSALLPNLASGPGAMAANETPPTYQDGRLIAPPWTPGGASILNSTIYHGALLR